METSLALVVYQPKGDQTNPRSPLPVPGSQTREPDYSMAMVLYEKRSEEASNSTPATQKKRKERVKALLKNCVPFSPEELPPGLNPGSIYYKGTCIGLPKGWVIEVRPRSNRTADQFFYAPRTGKQFRSLIEVRKFLKNQTTNDEPETDEYPWDEINRRNKRRKEIQAPQPLRQLPPEPQSPFQEMFSTGANMEDVEQLMAGDTTHGPACFVGRNALQKKVNKGARASTSKMNELTVKMKEEMQEMVKQQVQESITVFVKRLLEENPGIVLNIPSGGVSSDGNSASTKQ